MRPSLQELQTLGNHDFNPRTPCGVRQDPRPARCRLPNFNPRTPCGVRLQRQNGSAMLLPFQSTHPLRGATPSENSAPRVSLFQSTHPLRGATDGFARSGHRAVISIHAPLAGCDLHRGRFLYRQIHFNPRTPCGVRLNHSVKGHDFSDISIHAPLAGCDAFSATSTI